MPANPEILSKLKSYVSEKTGNTFDGDPPTGGGAAARGADVVHSAASSIPPKKKMIQLLDKRTTNPVTGQPMSDRLRKSLNIDPEGGVRDIIAHAKAKGIDPYTALALSYQETGLGTDSQGGFYHLNPDYYSHPFANPQQGVDNIVGLFKYAKDMQKKGIVPQGEASFLQGYNGYGKIKRGHADLDGASSIYGYPIPDEGISFKKNPLYGKTVISLRDEILKKNADIQQMVNATPAYSAPQPTNAIGHW